MPASQAGRRRFDPGLPLHRTYPLHLTPSLPFANQRWLTIKMSWMRKVIILAICAATLISTWGCSDQVRVSNSELTGTYAMEFQNVSYSLSEQKRVVNYKVTEQFILNPDHTYTQRFSSYPRTFTSRGTWKASNRFLGGTDVELSGVDRSSINVSRSIS
jgi:hypothetical protein